MNTMCRPGSEMWLVMRAPFVPIGSFATWTMTSWPSFRRSWMLFGSFERFSSRPFRPPRSPRPPGASRPSRPSRLAAFTSFAPPALLALATPVALALRPRLPGGVAVADLAAVRRGARGRRPGAGHSRGGGRELRRAAGAGSAADCAGCSASAIGGTIRPGTAGTAAMPISFVSGIVVSGAGGGSGSPGASALGCGAAGTADASGAPGSSVDAASGEATGAVGSTAGTGVWLASAGAVRARSSSAAASCSSGTSVTSARCSPSVSSNSSEKSGSPYTSPTYRNAAFSRPMSTKAACMPGSTRTTRPL